MWRQCWLRQGVERAYVSFRLFTSSASNSPFKGSFTWTWTFHNNRKLQLYWSVASARKTVRLAPLRIFHTTLNIVLYKCMLTWRNEPRVQVAEFIGVIPTNFYGTPKAPPTITIFPAAHEHQGVVDQILLTALILERQRLTMKFPVGS